MGDDWKPGDLALRVRRGERCPECGLEPDITPGEVHTVSAVARDSYGPMLFFIGFDDPPHICDEESYHHGHDPAHFRKINPLTDEEREQFTEDLNAPVKERVS